ncbi:MAG: hypothetical protein M1813_004664 [Trichoglossum hirsutum]|nr:MAG: hypothetical protein M1813_004664 [Trichoglossum hirsutum]
MQSLTTSYLLPALLLNPVLILHTLNSLLCRLLPSFADQPLPTWSDPTTWGPHGTPPYLDVHSSDNLCWFYTICMVFLQLFAFERISTRRCDAKEKVQAETKKIVATRDDDETIARDNVVATVEVIPRKVNVTKKLSDDRASKLNTEAYVERLEEWGRKSDAVAGFFMG